MLISVVARHLLLLFTIASPALVLAQFQKPTDEELKMSTDPQAPGAAAVYLNIEEISNDPLHYQSYYARIKVLSEKGKELAPSNFPTSRMTSRLPTLRPAPFMLMAQSFRLLENPKIS
jgi:hypothetical protein